MTIRFAMIGTGRIASESLAPAIAAVEGAELWSVLSRDRARGEAFARDHGARAPAPVHTDLDALLRDPHLDAVLIASPDRLHAAQAIAAARAGKHVLCEKPMATEVEEARAMVRAAADAGVKLGVAYHMRWHAGHRMIRDEAVRGVFGTLRHVRVQWSFLARDASNWRAKAEVGRWWGLGGVGTHCLDQARWFLLPVAGEMERMESLITREVFGGPHDETAILALAHAGGATAEICSSVLFAGPRRMEVYGSDGWAVLDDTLGPHGAGRVLTHEGERSFTPVDPYAGEIRDFVAAIEEDRPPEVDGAEGARNVEILVRAVS